jgi:hypothetical protein
MAIVINDDVQSNAGNVLPPVEADIDMWLIEDPDIPAICMPMVES